MSWLWWSVISVSIITMGRSLPLNHDLNHISNVNISDLTLPHPCLQNAAVTREKLSPVSCGSGGVQFPRFWTVNQTAGVFSAQQTSAGQTYSMNIWPRTTQKDKQERKCLHFSRKCLLLTIKVTDVSSFVPCLWQWGKVEPDEGLMARSYGGSATPEAVHQTHRRGHGGLPSKQARWGSRPAVVAGPLTLKDLWRSKSNTQQEREQQRGRTER